MKASLEMPIPPPNTAGLLLTLLVFNVYGVNDQRINSIHVS